MPTQKDLKRRIRRRMQKTGEAYTAARAQLLRKKEHPAPVDFARLAGMSDEAVRKATGCTWERWTHALDRARAHEMPHREIARLVREKYRVNSWWAQTVTVGYERIRGLREIGQRRTGAFEVNKSKTIGVPVSDLYRAFADKRRRTRWLGAVDLTIRTSRRDRSMRITWPDGSNLQIGFSAKGPARSQVTVQHGRLPDRRAADAQREFWTGRLTALMDQLTA